MNALLTEVFTEKEVFEALQSIRDLKAPRLDSMPSVFYKKILGYSRRKGDLRSFRCVE